MIPFAKVISLLAISATIVPCLLYFFGIVDQSTVLFATLVGSVAWFLATPVWLGRKLPIDANQVEI